MNCKQSKEMTEFLKELVDVNNGKVLIPATNPSPGHWFGGGNMVWHDGAVYLCGRYRDYGDSRSGLTAGIRGRECAVFRSQDGGETFEKVQSWSKSDLSTSENEVLSIEGTALHQLSDGSWEMFISTEKKMNYPEGYEAFQKPGTGVWSIDRITGETPEKMNVNSLEPMLWNAERPEYLHVKDPTVWDLPDGSTAMAFCTHPFTWASGGSGLAVRGSEGEPFHVRNWEFTHRGPAWDVGVCRITGTFSLAEVSGYEGQDAKRIFFYDGAECMRSHEEHKAGDKRPRGYCCEELGGAFAAEDNEQTDLRRLSSCQPLFVSPYATGCCRYVDALVLPDGILATWQQAQPDGSQPLVGHKIRHPDSQQGK